MLAFTRDPPPATRRRTNTCYKTLGQSPAHGEYTGMSGLRTNEKTGNGVRGTLIPTCISIYVWVLRRPRALANKNAINPIPANTVEAANAY